MKSSARTSVIDSFTLGYFVAMSWTECNSDKPEIDGLGMDDLTPEAFAEGMEDCRQFQQEQAAALTNAYEHHDYSSEQAGHDFWLTRNGHGAGFIDRDLGDLSDSLADAARAFGEQDISEGDFVAPADRLMAPAEAWEYAASWGSAMTSGDPGACMYGFDETCRPQSEEHRQDVLAWIADCRKYVLEHQGDYEEDELTKLDSFVRYITGAPVADFAATPN